MVRDQGDANQVVCCRTLASAPRFGDGDLPFLGREIAAPDPAQSDELALLVFVHDIDEFLQLLANAILPGVCVNAHEVIVAGVGVVRVQFFLNIELARLDDHEADFVGIDVGHCWLLIIKRRLRITRAAGETASSFSYGNGALMPNLPPQTNRRRKNRFSPFRCYSAAIATSASACFAARNISG